MKPLSYTIKAVVIALVALLALQGLLWNTLPVFAQTPTRPMNPNAPDPTTSARVQQGRAVIQQLSKGAGQPALPKLEKDFPFLVEATLAYSLGDVWSRPGLDPKTRQLATVAAFAAQGILPQLKVHAGYALNLGVTKQELAEIIYLTTVHAGFPRALNAANALEELYAERGL